MTDARRLPTRSSSPPVRRRTVPAVSTAPIVTDGEVPDQAYARDLRFMSSPVRQKPEPEARFFVPADRFVPSKIADAVRDAPSLPERLEAVRPVDWMMAFRCDPAPAEKGTKSRPLTAQDQAILEVLLSAQRESDPSMRGRFAQCPVAAIRNVCGSTLSDTSLENSLRRLSTIECVLPGVHAAKARMTWRRKKAIADAEANPDEDRAQARAWSAAAIAREPFTREPAIEQMYAMRIMKRRDRVGPPRPGPVIGLTRQPDERAEDWFEGQRHRLRRFVPVVRWIYWKGTVYFELATWLRVWTDSSRTGPGHSRTPYASIDLRQIAGFSSSYSAPLYRQLIGRTFDPDTRVARVGDVVVRIPLADLPEAVGYRVQRMGLAAQLKRKVIEPTDVDFEAMAGRVTISRGHIDGADAVWTVRVPVDVGRMRSTAKWRLPDGRIEKIVSGTHRDDLRPLKVKEVFHLRVRSTAFLKTMNKLRLDRDGIVRYARAWQLAVDEALRREDPRYSDLTGRGHARTHRGARLMLEIASDGPEIAFFRWASEEQADSDLTRPEVLDVLELDGTERAAAQDRQARWAQARWRRSAEPFRTERLDGRLPVDPAELERRRMSREEDAKHARWTAEARQAERSEFLADLKTERTGEPSPFAGEPAPVVPVRASRFAVRRVETAIGYVPDPEVRLDEIEGELHFVWRGTRQDAPVRIDRVVEELEMLGYDRPTIADLTENAPALFEGETGTFEIVPPQETDR